MPSTSPEVKPRRRSKEEAKADREVRALTPYERIEDAWKVSGGTMPMRVVFYREDHAKEAAAIIKKKRYGKTLEARYEVGPAPKGVLV